MSDQNNTINSETPNGSSDEQHVSGNKRVPPPASWKGYQKILFRIAFVFFILVSIPLSSSWYKNAAGIDWFRPHYRDIYDIARFNPSVRSFFGISRGGGYAGDAEGAIAAGPSEAGNQSGSANRRNEAGRPDRRRDSSGTRNNVQIGGDSSKFVKNNPNEERGNRSRGNRPARDSANTKELAAIDSAKEKISKQDTTTRRAALAASANDEGNGRAERSFLYDYIEWGYALLVATIVGLIWSVIDRKRKEYNVLYYVIKVVVRYRAAIGIIGFGFTKLFPTQMPYPSLGLLNTDFGDFTAQKIYWLSVGIVPWYQVFGGVVELLAGGLLLFRKTATYGAILLIGALGDITFVNYAYDGGVHVYAFYFVLLGSFLLVDDIPRLYNLLIREKYTVPSSYYPYYTKNWLGYTRIGLKSLTFIIFFVILTYTEVINFKYDPYKQPSTAGVKQLRGNYEVTEFKINDKVIPYSPLDSVRWQQATFENWTTLTFKVNKPVYVDPSNGGGSPMRDIQRTFEIAGTAGGQRAFHYYADTIDQVLYLQDKNAVAAMRRGRTAGGDDTAAKYPENWISKAAWEHIGDENKMIAEIAWSGRRDKEFSRPLREIGRDKMILNYHTTDGSRVILSGLNENRDSIYVVLDKIDKKYNLSKSTLNAGKY